MDLLVREHLSLLNYAHIPDDARKEKKKKILPTIAQFTRSICFFFLYALIQCSFLPEKIKNKK